MISRLRGEVWEAGPGRLVVGCGGVGYEVHVAPAMAAQTVPGAAIDLHTRLVVREDEWTLYGFPSPADRHAFDLLRETKGCGSKLSLALVAHLGAAQLAQAVARNDTAALARAPGIGPRLAERICTELRGKAFDAGPSGDGAVGPAGEDEVVSALVSLGYRRPEAETAARSQQEGSVEDRIRAALRTLRK